METMTLEQVNACIDTFKVADLNVARQAVLSLAESYAAHLAAQAEWPSEEDVERAHKAYWDTPDDHKGDDRHAMRAAMQSVRPPVGVVSDEVVNRVAAHMARSVEYIEKVYPGARQLDAGPIMRNLRRWSRMLSASRHAPTKD